MANSQWLDTVMPPIMCGIGSLRPGVEWHPSIEKSIPNTNIIQQ